MMGSYGGFEAQSGRQTQPPTPVSPFPRPLSRTFAVP